MQKIGVIGSAIVGQTLAQGFRKHGDEVRIGSRTPARLADFSAASHIEAGTFAMRMVNPQFSAGTPTMFYCGNDADAKAFVARVLDRFGWQSADMGTAAAARAIEALAQLWCIPGFRQNSWTHAFSLLWS